MLHVHSANSGFQTSLEKGGKQSKREIRKERTKSKEKHKHQFWSQQPCKAISAFLRPRQLGIAKIMPLWVINLSLQFGWNMKFANIFLFLLDQGYVPGIFGVSHGALQFMAYEQPKKGYSHYFGTSINERLVNTVCTCLCGCLYGSYFYINCLLFNLCLVNFLFLHRV